jgi:hypothetical protein
LKQFPLVKKKGSIQQNDIDLNGEKEKEVKWVHTGEKEATIQLDHFKAGDRTREGGEVRVPW